MVVNVNDMVLIPEQGIFYLIRLFIEKRRCHVFFKDWTALKSLNIYSTISRPLDGKMTRGKALMLLVLVYMYVAPWVFLPATQTWGRFSPGKLLALGDQLMCDMQCVCDGAVALTVRYSTTELSQPRRQSDTS